MSKCTGYLQLYVANLLQVLPQRDEHVGEGYTSVLILQLPGLFWDSSQIIQVFSIVKIILGNMVLNSTTHLS